MTVTKVLASRRGQGHRRPHLLGPGTPAGVYILLQVSQGQGQLESSIHPGILWDGLLLLEVTGGNLGMRTMVTCVKFQALLGWTPQPCPPPPSLLSHLWRWAVLARPPARAPGLRLWGEASDGPRFAVNVSVVGTNLWLLDHVVQGGFQMPCSYPPPPLHASPHSTPAVDTGRSRAGGPQANPKFRHPRKPGKAQHNLGSLLLAVLSFRTRLGPVKACCPRGDGSKGI